ncbi:MAG: hypothetical protein LUG98_15685 [Tannerellaceae bacterium]|nr:hypothetical protein [Tannerellaceae bacterium]
MKKLTFISSIFTGILLFTSCLGEGGHVIELGLQPAVAGIEDEEIFFYIKDTERVLPSTSSSLNFGAGECALISYKVDLSEQDHTNSVDGGYYTVTLTTTPTTVPRWSTGNQLTDTATVLPNEWIISSMESRYGCVRNQLFLYTNLSLPDSLLPVRSFDLSFTPNQTILEDTTLQKNYNVVHGYVCEMFLRVEKFPGEGTVRQPRNTHRDVNAFPVGDLVSTFAQYAEDDSLFVRIKYAKSFNSDSTKLNWGESEAFRIPVRR